MIKTALHRHSGVHRRADSGIYQFGLRAPVDLRQHYPSGWALRCSLGTADLRQANDKAKALQAEWAARFESLRTGKPMQVDVVALRAKLLDYVERRLLTVDQRTLRLTEAEREQRAGACAWQRDDARQELAAGRVPDWAEEMLDRIGYARSPMADVEAMPYVVMMFELYHEALTDPTRTFPLRVAQLNARHALAAIAAPSTARAATTTTKKANGRRIADALSAWVEKKQPPAKTVSAFTRHANQFAALMGDPLLSSIDRVAANDFRDKLQAWALKEHKTANTANNVLTSIRATINVARDRGWIEGNPFERLSVDVGGKRSRGREPWAHDELRTLFDDPIWTEYQLPTDSKAGADAAYWIPLIACYTGARISEIAQLRTNNLTTKPGREVIEFLADEEHGQSLKTEGSWRAVPMHSELVRLGLPEYVDSVPKGPLFPKLPIAGMNGAGGQFGKWFGDYKKGKGFKSSSKSFHSFRHLVATELRYAGVTDALADAITGHAGQGQGLGRTVYSATIRREAERLRQVIEKLDFPDLALNKVFARH